MRPTRHVIGSRHAVASVFLEKLEELVQVAAAGQAELSSSEATGGPVVIELKPFRRTAAPISLQIEPGAYVLEIGAGSRFEFLGRGGATVEEDAAEVLRFVEAVIRGQYQEKVWLRNGKVAQVWGNVQVEGSWRSARQFSVWPLPWLYARQHRKYEAYV